MWYSIDFQQPSSLYLSFLFSTTISSISKGMYGE